MRAMQMLLALTMVAACGGVQGPVLHPKDGGLGGSPGGSGGVVAGTGGALGTGGSGGTVGSGGTGGLPAGGNSGSGTGGNKGTGESVGSGGNQSGTGGAGPAGGSGGGVGGSGGRTTPISGTGGGIDGGSAGSGTGGRATGGAGGITTGGAGGMATGDSPGLDAGMPDAPPAKCINVTTSAACEARSDCHSVFVDPGDCGCATLGCCTRFQSCADSDKANCDGPVACTLPMPRCESPYIVAAKGACYEGCVKQTDCALPACPQARPTNGAACGPVPVSQTCYYEDCAGEGRAVATCAAGASTWQVATGACASFACAGDSLSLTCQPGMVCILTTQIGPVAPIPTPTCVAHTCGTGPITPECVPSLYGTCTATYSVGGAVFRCESVSDCGEPICA